MDATDIFIRRFEALNTLYLKKVGAHIRQIGRLTPSDVHIVEQMAKMGENMADIQTRLAKILGASSSTVEQLFADAAQRDIRLMNLPGVSRFTVRDNPRVMRLIRAQSAQTAGTLINLSNTTATSNIYRTLVDAACQAVTSGVTDYASEIRRALRYTGQMGLVTRQNGTQAVTYASGYTRRVDTAVRQNILDGSRQLNQKCMMEVGGKFGADGVEIDAHMLCADDHLPYQGRQYTTAEFEDIQASLRRPFGEWNCRHFVHPIIIGVSERTYTNEQLREYRDWSTEKVEIDGQTHTRYEWSQRMRATETAIRKEKDTKYLAKAAGDNTLAGECDSRISTLLKQYDRISGASGLKAEYARTRVDA